MLQKADNYIDVSSLFVQWLLGSDNGLKAVQFYFTSESVPQEMSSNCEIKETNIENIQAESYCLPKDYISDTQDETLNPLIL